MLRRWEYVVHMMARYSVSTRETLFIKSGITADDDFARGGVPKSVSLRSRLVTYEDHGPRARFEFGASVRRAMNIGSTPEHTEVGDIGREGCIPHGNGRLPVEPTHGSPIMDVGGRCNCSLPEPTARASSVHHCERAVKEHAVPAFSAAVLLRGVWRCEAMLD